MVASNNYTIYVRRMEMRRLLLFFVTALLAMAMMSGGASAAVIYDNGAPDTSAAGIASDPISGIVVADDFVLNSGANVITDLHWWGYWVDYNSEPPVGPMPTTNNFTITIYAPPFPGLPPEDQLPGDQAYSCNIGDVDATKTEMTAADGMTIYSYYYVFTTPLTLEAGWPYWLSIENDSDMEEIGWYWASAGVGQCWYKMGEDAWEPGWGAVLAFNLTGETCEIPEPTTMFLLGFGLISLAGLRRKN